MSFRNHEPNFILEANNALMIHLCYCSVAINAMKDSLVRLTPYCLDLQWHDYMSLLRMCVFFCLSL